jgi:hypothetical protein
MLAASLAAATYRASGLVLWHFCDIARTSMSAFGQAEHGIDIAE